MGAARPLRTGAVVLAAGAASRFGGDKLLATLDGKPLVTGRIAFHQADGQFVGAKIDKDARFKVDRVPVGSHKVTVESKGVPDRYASEEQSVLRVEVRAGANEFDFNLKSN